MSSTILRTFVETPITVSNELVEFTLLSCTRELMSCADFCQWKMYRANKACEQPTYPSRVHPPEHVWDVLRIQYMLHNKYDWTLDMPSFFLNHNPTAFLYDENLIELSPYHKVPYQIPFCENLQPSSSRHVKPGTRGVREERIGYPEGHEVRQIRFKIAVPTRNVGSLTATMSFWLVFEMRDGLFQCVDESYLDVLSIMSRIADVRAGRVKGFF